MASKSRWHVAAGVFVCAALLIGQTDLISQNRNKQERKIRDRIEEMKADPEGLYFARSETPPEEQEKIAQDLIKKIQELSQTEGFDYPDYDKILEYARDILLKAPDAPMAQMAHWNIHTLFMMKEDDQEAGRALLSYVHKYPEDEWRIFEAYDKLCVFATDADDWGLALYYADKILEKEPDRYPLILTKARSLIRLGEREAGKALLERIVKEAEGTVQYNLAMMELEELETPKQGEDPAADPLKEEGIEERRETDVPQDPLLKDKYRKTMNDLNYAGAAIQMYLLDTMKPPAKLDDLVPTFIEEGRLNDAWGNRFLYKIDNQNNTFWLASGGSDGRLQGFDQKGTYIELDGQDIIFYDHDFVFQPEFR